jgi:hypothetical protein
VGGGGGGGGGGVGGVGGGGGGGGEKKRDLLTRNKKPPEPPPPPPTARFWRLSRCRRQSIPNEHQSPYTKHMNLRPLMAFCQSPRWRFALLAGLALAVLSVGRGTGDAAAGLNDYSLPLYLSGTTATHVSGSYTLANAAGPGTGLAKPTATPVAGGSLVASTPYTYEYSVVDSNGIETPVGATFSTTTTVANKSVTVGGLPTGVKVRLYRQTGVATNPFNLLKELPSNASATFLDDGTLSLGAAPPQQAQNTLTGLTNADLGYYEFVPGGAPGGKVASPGFSGRGWVVDAPGAVSIVSGPWTFTNNLKALPNGGLAKNGTADLVIGMWKVDDTGAVVGSSPIIDPTVAGPTGGENTGTNIAIAAGYNYNSGAPAGLTTTTVTGVPAISLAAGEHLYVQFWRRQKTIGATSPLNPTVTLATYDGVSKIAHPTANAFPDTPVLVAVPARTNATPQLSASFTDLDTTDTGTLSFQLCSDPADCAGTLLQSGMSASGVVRNQNGSWTPPANIAPADHSGDRTYYWRARSQDSAGNWSDWSSTNSFDIDTVAPTTPGFVSPAAASRVNSTQVSATFTDTGDNGTLSFQLCNDSLCSSLVSGVAPFTSGNVASGSNVNWTPTGVADGAYYWRVRAQDVAGNYSDAGAWTATRSIVLDTTAPPAPTLDAVAALVKTPPQLSAPFSDPVTTDTDTLLFQVCTDNTCSTTPSASASRPVTNGATGTFTPGSLPDEIYYVRVNATDTAGNPSAWSTVTTFRLDGTAPSVPALGAVAARTSTTPQLSTTYLDNASTGTLTLQLCTNSTCTSVSQSTTSSSIASGTAFNWTPANLADGTYYWRASAQDEATNLSSWSAAASFVVDTVAPNTPTLTAPIAAARINSTQVTATFTDADASDSGTLSFQLCSDTTCSSVLSSSTSSTVSVGAGASWTPAAGVDGVYSWRVRGQDAAGNLSAWSATRSFTLDTTLPSTPALGAPADASYLAAAPALSANFADTDAGDTGSLVFQICADSGCGTLVTSGSSTTGVANGAAGSWTPAGLAGGDYYWRAAGRDAAGNQSAWSATRSFTLDRTPPGVPTLTILGGATRYNHFPSLTATYTDPGAATGGSLTFQLCRTSSCANPVATTTNGGVPNGAVVTWAVAGAGNGDGTYYARASAQDALGNQSAWSAVGTFTLDSTPPSPPSPIGNVALRARTTPALSARVNEPGDPGDAARMLFELCSDATCGNVLASGYSSTVPVGSVASWRGGAMPDGAYYWRAFAEDLVGNQSAWSVTGQFVVDNVAPSVPATPAPDNGALVKAARLTGTFRSDDANDDGRLVFQVCSDAACTNVVAGGTSGSVAASAVAATLRAASLGATGNVASWTAGNLLDGSYFWRVRAEDEAGNNSDWSSTQSFTLDRTPPSKPRAFSATASGRTLTLRWQSPAAGAAIAGYALLVNGRRIRILDADKRIVRVRLLDNDKRSFAIAAIDGAGNIGASTADFVPSTQTTVKKAQARTTPPLPTPARKPRRI